MRSFWISKIFGCPGGIVPDDDAAFERQEGLGSELQNIVSIRAINADPRPLVVRIV